MALAITSTNPYFGNTASQSDSGTNYTQRYLVKFSDFATASAADLQLAETQALTANGIPKIADAFRGNKAAFCKGKNATVLNQDNKPVGVIVACTFSTVGTEKKDQEENPLDKAPDVTWNVQSEREAVTAARRMQAFQGGQPLGNPINAQNFFQQQFGDGINFLNGFSLAITNSFGGIPNPFPEKDVPYPTVTIVRNVPSAGYSGVHAASFVQTINREAFSVDGEQIDKETALCLQNSSTIKYQGNGVSYREVTTTLLFKGTHAIQTLDNGSHAYIAESQKFKSGIDAGTETTRDGQPAIRRLDGKGNVLDDKKDDVFLHWEVLDTSDFRQLNLPTRKL